MMPGMNQYADMINSDDASKAMKHSKAIIQSMTPYERRNPQRIRTTMKKRIAKGSGTTVNDVTKLINQFAKTKKMMDSFGMMAKSGAFSEDKIEKTVSDLEEKVPELKQYRGIGGKKF